MNEYFEGQEEYEERFFLDSEDEIFGLLEKLGSDDVEKDVEEYESGDLTAVVDYSLAHPDGRRFSTALIYNDDVTARVELQLDTPEGSREVAGFITEPAYDVFAHPANQNQARNQDRNYLAKTD